MTSLRSSLSTADEFIAGFQAAPRLPIIFAPEGYVLNADEIAFFKQAQPFGFILFQRNCESKEQMRALVKALRDCVGWNCPVLIDQEGGRVQRMKAPNWPALPSSAVVAARAVSDIDHVREAVELQAQCLAAMLQDVNIDVNCMPVCDVTQKGVTDNSIGDRAYAAQADIVADLTDTFVGRSLSLGMTSTVKHMPGHGRGNVDSHKELPIVDADPDVLWDTDFLPFRQALENRSSASVWGMIAHVMFMTYDQDLPSSLSPVIVQDVLREKLGYTDSLLLTDDLNMGALTPFGSLPELTQKSLAAGMDIILHCSGVLSEMKSIATALPAMRADTQARVVKWLQARSDAVSHSGDMADDLDFDSAYQRLQAHLSVKK